MKTWLILLIELPNNKYYIFGKDGGKALSEEMNVDFLGQIPLVQSVREASDAGRPAVLQGSTTVANYLSEVADNIVKSIKKRITNLAPTKAVELTHFKRLFNKIVVMSTNIKDKEVIRKIKKALKEIRPF